MFLTLVRYFVHHATLGRNVTINVYSLLMFAACTTQYPSAHVVGRLLNVIFLLISKHMLGLCLNLHDDVVSYHGIYLPGMYVLYPLFPHIQIPFRHEICGHKKVQMHV